MSLLEKARSLIKVDKDKAELDPDNANFQSKLFACIWCFSMWTPIFAVAGFYLPLWFTAPILLWFNFSAGTIFLDSRAE